MKHLHKSGKEKPAASSPVRQKLIIASNNQGKIREFRKLLEPFGFDVVSMREAGFTDEIVEDGDTFEENAHIKARAVFEATKLPTIADDSGLEIDFVARIDNQIALIEVKATTGRTKSADTIVKNPDRYGPTVCIRLGNYNVGEANGRLTLPYYMAFLLK